MGNVGLGRVLGKGALGAQEGPSQAEESRPCRDHCT
eukprot:COSAG01_NODE_2895_length_6901_cov_35.009262_11_plen_36_part_00